MMHPAQSESVLIGERREIVWMRCIHYKPNKGAALFGWPENTHSGQFRETLGCIASKMRVVFKNCWASDLLVIFNRSRESDRDDLLRRANITSEHYFIICSLHLVLS